MTSDKEGNVIVEVEQHAHPEPKRERMPDSRHSVTSKRVVGFTKFYVTVGFYDAEDRNGDPAVPGEVFVKIAKTGSTVDGLMDGIALLMSIGLQYGVPWPVLRQKFRHTSFEPSGAGTDGTEYSSLLDALAIAVDEIVQEKRSLWGEENKDAEEK